MSAPWSGNRMRAFFRLLFAAAAVLSSLAIACTPEVATKVVPIASQSAPAARKPSLPPYWVSFTRGEFDKAREALRIQVEAGGVGAREARARIAFLDAVTTGSFAASIQLLRDSWAADRDFETGSSLARLLDIQGSTQEALRLASELLATDAPDALKIDLCETLLADAESSEHERTLAYELLRLDGFNDVALSHSFGHSVLAGDRAQASDLWRRLHLVDLLGTELYDDEASALEGWLRSDWRDAHVAERLAAALVDAGFCAEALHVAKDVVGDSIEETRRRARSFVRFRGALARGWRRAATSGLEVKWAQSVLDHEGKELVDALGVENFGELYAVLRDRYAHHFVLDLESPLGMTTDLARVIHDASRRVPLFPEPGTVRRIVTGAPRLRFAWVLAPLTARAGTKHFFRSDWGESIVLRSDESIGVARRDWDVLIGASTDPAARLKPLADLALPPNAIVSTYMIGNQGNLLRDQMRRLALREALSDAWFLRADERDLETAFLGRLVLGDLRQAEVHEGRHAVDAALGGTWTEGEKELRAYLSQMICLPGLSQLNTLSIVATGGNPDLSANPHEWANLELLQHFVRILLADLELAPHIDRTRNLQAQLNLLSPEEAGEIASRIWQSRFAPADER
jgi:hypothetical protein